MESPKRWNDPAREGRALSTSHNSEMAQGLDVSGDLPQWDACVAVLLATYNGEKHLDAQIRSIFSQTHQNFIVIARDDGSTDRTLEILDQWARNESNRLIVVSDERGNLRSLANFSLLMELCSTSYFTFCDQDDIWMPNKLELSLREIQRLESHASKTVPILVHSDLKIVDDDLQVISPSYFAHKSIDLTHAGRLDQLLFNNIVSGCTLMGNRALLEMGRPIPPNFPYHDWWLALIAASCGILRTIDTPTILYRQHAENQVGAGRYQKKSSLWDGRHVLQQPTLLRTRMKKALGMVHSYAAILLRVVGDKMPAHNRALLQAFCLPLLHDELALMRWPRRAWLFVRFLAIHVRLFPLALRWCY